MLLKWYFFYHIFFTGTEGNSQTEKIIKAKKQPSPIWSLSDQSTFKGLNPFSGSKDGNLPVQWRESWKQATGSNENVQVVQGHSRPQDLGGRQGDMEMHPHLPLCRDGSTVGLSRSECHQPCPQASPHSPQLLSCLGGGGGASLNCLEWFLHEQICL